jgi:4-alpha-glucanotransferase
MLVHFYVRFSTKPGQSLFLVGNATELGNNNSSQAIPLTYIDVNFWGGSFQIDTNKVDILTYKYILKEAGKEDSTEYGDDKAIDLSEYAKKELTTIDTWQTEADYRNNFYTQAFQQVLLSNTSSAVKIKKVKQFTHEFRVKTPILNTNEVLCVVGSASALGNWQNTQPVLLHKLGNWWTAKVDIQKQAVPITYKYGVFNTKTKQFLQYETGDNRVLLQEPSKTKVIVLHDGYANITSNNFKGAGVAIPVFSLRSKNSFGVGEFTDLKLLIDWAKKTGLKLVQLLPINDTIATHTWKDSYPYAAISAFALHPMYLNLQQVAGKENESVIKALQKKQKQLNQLPHVDYEQVIQFKLSAIKELYLLKKDALKEDINYFNFFELNRHWLVPYAAFCYLRDKHKTIEFNTWRSNSKYSEAAIQRLISPTQKHYHEIAVHYFTQYQLHLQLKEATAHAHKNGIVVKGDLPIGIYRNSVDAWMEPELYNMEEQAGAPPDDFAVKGQNWSFPTYNWKKMANDNYTWWRKRFEQMSNYFDAFRIDHILGFFRIWSIPLHAVEGILGRFMPALPVHVSEFAEKGIYFNYDRFCTPYITEQVLQQEFGDKTDYVKKMFLNGYQLKEEFATQRKVEKYFTNNAIEDENIKIGLYNLISNVILLEEEGTKQQQFHFRISMTDTWAYKNLDSATQTKLYELYINYFYYRQDDFWKKEAMQKLPSLKRSTNMLVCGEDLGMVPHCVPEVMQQLSILTLEIQRMPKKTGIEFFHPNDAPYLSVLTPSTHDMSTLRTWWMEDKAKIQRFYNTILGKYGEAPFYCEPWISKEIVQQHLYSPAMWSIFQLQDMLGINEKIRRENPDDERINIPANPNHYWQYRMHILLEDLLKEKEFNGEIKNMVEGAGR